MRVPVRRGPWRGPWRDLWRDLWRRVLAPAALGLALASVVDQAASRPALTQRLHLPQAGGYFQVPMETIRAARFRNIVAQRYDFSCGSAALATLLTYHYRRETTEADAFKAMYEAGDRARIRQVGFSLLDMQRYLAARGLRADGFRLGLDRLAVAGVPAIALVNPFGYKHFVVIKGIGRGEVLVGDPALGMRVMSRAAFGEIWDGIVFVIRDEVPVGRAHFNLADDWSVRVKAPLGSSLSRQTSLSDFAVQLWRGGLGF
ncbi:cysteine peptidase family C39 domain-containing protein [Rhodothalassium salexigens]|uniref:cysteine peptidase family C39 domain-containing protein n=1 Tax=Rhodothalassium salexigens TaxID=1086 RepID=UPI001913A2E1